jgi:hypothetical protein
MRCWDRENLYIIKTLKEFQFIDEFGKDQGANGTSLLSHYLQDDADLVWYSPTEGQGYYQLVARRESNVVSAQE